MNSSRNLSTCARATQRIKRVIDKIALEENGALGPAEGGLRGNLSQMKRHRPHAIAGNGAQELPPDLHHAGERCDVYIVDGQISHASYGSGERRRRGLQSAHVGKGQFSKSNFEGRSSEQTITRSTQGLMMEGLRILDESRRDGEGTSAGDQEGNQEDVLLDS